MKRCVLLGFLSLEQFIQRFAILVILLCKKLVLKENNKRAKEDEKKERRECWLNEEARNKTERLKKMKSPEEALSE